MNRGSKQLAKLICCFFGVRFARKEVGFELLEQFPVKVRRKWSFRKEFTFRERSFHSRLDGKGSNGIFSGQRVVLNGYGRSLVVHVLILSLAY
jgi:hypothetical protein